MFNYVLCVFLLVAFKGICWLWSINVAFPSHIDMLIDVYVDVVVLFCLQCLGQYHREKAWNCQVSENGGFYMYLKIFNMMGF